ncbi:MAG: DNA helicase RecQ, partial [Elusimicrobiota bacterium]
MQNFPEVRHSGESGNPGMDARLRGHDGKGGGLKTRARFGEVLNGMLKERVQEKEIIGAVGERLAALGALIKRVWGYGNFLPLQQEAMAAVVEGRDCLVILSTGGGKSLCYQAPAVFTGGTAIVISPLIALMKDQVDDLIEAGVAAAYLNSSLSAEEQGRIELKALAGNYRLLYVAPERLVRLDFLELLKRIKPSFFVIDEAHCISHWGHDFRPEYRALSVLHQKFPSVPIHAFTATATEQVRKDIVEQLVLRDPDILVGNFDRANLIYRAVPRQGLMDQITAVLKRHPKESGIIYAIRRSDVEKICAQLKTQGIRAMAYHAGMTAAQRGASQDAFSREEIDVIVATVAFGMGVNRSNVRYVIHAGLPKSIEHYQQETGRAGRDGLSAECALFYSGEDFFTWKFIMEKESSATLPIDLKKLGAMNGFARGGFCRHSYLVGYFNQEWRGDKCGACDFCLGEIRLMPDSGLIAKKIISAVYRLKERFGADYVSDVLRGAQTAKIKSNGHDQLSTFGLLKDHSKRNIRLWIDQLLSQGFLLRADGEYPTLSLTPQATAVLREQCEVQLSFLERPKKEVPVSGDADEALFEKLRVLRRTIADELGVPAYIVFGDKTLLEMSRLKPENREALRQVWGVGQQKLERFGSRFLDCLRACANDAV